MPKISSTCTSNHLPPELTDHLKCVSQSSHSLLNNKPIGPGSPDPPAISKVPQMNQKATTPTMSPFRDDWKVNDSFQVLNFSILNDTTPLVNITIPEVPPPSSINNSIVNCTPIVDDIPTPDLSDCTPIVDDIPTPDLSDCTPIVDNIPTPDLSDCTPIVDDIPTPDLSDCTPIVDNIPTPDLSDCTPIVDDIPTPDLSDCSYTENTSLSSKRSMHDSPDTTCISNLNGISKVPAEDPSMDSMDTSFLVLSERGMVRMKANMKTPRVKTRIPSRN